MLRAAQSRRVTFRVDRPGDVIEILRSAGLEAARDSEAVVLRGAAADRAAPDVAAINFMLVEAGIRVSGLEVKEPSLDQIFHEKVEAAALPLAA